MTVPVGTEAVVNYILLQELAAKAYGTPKLPFAMPDVAFDATKQAPDGRYLVVSVHWNAPGAKSLAAPGYVQRMGFLQVMVTVPKGSASVMPMNIAAQIRDDWSRGKKLFGVGVKLVISAAPYIVNPIQDEVRTQYPVIIPWQVADRA